MGAGGHLDDWLAYYPGLDIRRRLAMKLAYTNKPKGSAYNKYFLGLMMRDGLADQDKNGKFRINKMFSNVLWIKDNSEHEKILREIRAEMSPGERSRLNSPIAARQRIQAVLGARKKGEDAEAKVRESPVALLKKKVAERDRQIAHLEEQLAAAKNEEFELGFSFKRSSVDDIVRVICDPTTVSANKAKLIEKGILKTFKEREKAAGLSAHPRSVN